MFYSQRQPKMTAAIDLEEDITFDEQEQDVQKEVPRSQKLFKKSILIDGMINLTGKGSRLAVVKLTDAESNKSIGRMQVRRPDDVSTIYTIVFKRTFKKTISILLVQRCH